jgi:hypothetical protein
VSIDSRVHSPVSIHAVSKQFLDGENNHVGNDSDCVVDFDAAGFGSTVAAQSQLGLLPEQWAWAGPVDSGHSGTAWQSPYWVTKGLEKT